MSTGSYLTNRRETVEVSSCARSFETIIGAVDVTSPRLVSYGLYLATLKEMSRLLGGSQQDLDIFTAEPWARLRRYRAGELGIDVKVFPNGDLHLGDISASKQTLDSVRPLGISPTLDLVVIQMNVQDLISVPRSRSRPTAFRVKAPFQVDIISPDNYNLESFSIKYHRIEFLRIQQCDIEMILRAKAAESPLLALTDVSSLLNPLIPTLTLRQHRTVNAIVDWAIIQGDQSQELRSEHTDPSESWKSF